MSNLLPSWPLFSAFLLASIVLAITPGPGVVYIVTRSVSQGRRSGLASVAGVALGNLGNAIGASIGLAALFAASALAFAILKYTGAAYLIYLGIQTLRRPVAAAKIPVPASEYSRKVFRDGFIVALFNPKTAVFFAAFLPQFMSANATPILQSTALSLFFVAIAAATDTIYALAAGAIAPVLKRAVRIGSWGRYVTGATFIGLGIAAAISASRTRNN